MPKTKTTKAAKPEKVPSSFKAEALKKNSKAELQKTLTDLHEYLKKLEFQDNPRNNPEGLEELALNLISCPALSSHNKDKELKILIACCFADILRLVVPTHPYSDDQIKKIFSLIIREFHGISEWGSSLIAKTKYLLSRLVEVKAFSMLTNVDKDLSSISETFQVIFSSFKAAPMDKFDLFKAIEAYVLDIMITCVDDILRADKPLPLPPDLYDEIFQNLLGTEEAPRELARALISRCSNAFEVPLTSIINLALAGKSDSEFVQGNYLKLIYEINKISNSILISVISQLEPLIRDPDFPDRVQAIELVAKLFTESSGMISKNPSLFQTFISLFDDTREQVRHILIHNAPKFISHDYAISSIIEHLTERIKDVKQKNRQEAIVSSCKIILQAPQVATKDFLKEIAIRLRDKKEPVRKITFKLLSELYRELNSRWGANASPDQFEKYGWIPVEILKCYLVPSWDLKSTVDRAIDTILLPSDSLENRSKALITFLKHVPSITDETTSNSASGQVNGVAHYFTHFIQDKKKFQKDFAAFVAEAKPGSKGAGASEATLKKIGAYFPHYPDFDLQIQELLVKGGKPLWRCIDTLCQPSSTFNTIMATKKKIDGDYTKDFDKPLKDLTRAIVSRLSQSILPPDSVSYLVIQLQEKIQSCKGDKTVYDQLFNLLETLSLLLPESFIPTTTQLFFLLDEGGDIVDRTLKILSNVGRALKEDHVVAIGELERELIRFSTEGTGAQAKIATRILCKISPKVVLEEINKMIEQLENDENTEAALASLQSIAAVIPQDFLFHAEPVIKYIRETLLTKIDDDAPDPSNGVISKRSPLIEQQCQGIKLLAHYIRAIVSSKQSDERTNEQIDPIFKHLFDILSLRGKLVNTHEPKNDVNNSFIREAVVSAIIHAAGSVYADSRISTLDFLLLLSGSHDPCTEVRAKTVHKLAKKSSKLQLPLRSMVFMLSFIHDQDKDIRRVARDSVETAIHARSRFVKQSRDPKIVFKRNEYALPYLIFFLAHQYNANVDNLDSLVIPVSQLTFFLEKIVDSNNASFLKSMTDAIKFVKDSFDEKHQGIQVISEIAFKITQKLAHKFADQGIEVPISFPKHLFTTVQEPFPMLLPEGYVLPSIHPQPTETIGFPDLDIEKYARSPMPVEPTPSSSSLKRKRPAVSDVSEAPPTPKAKRSKTTAPATKGKKTAPAKKSATKKQASQSRKKRARWDDGESDNEDDAVTSESESEDDEEEEERLPVSRRAAAASKKKTPSPPPPPTKTKASKTKAKTSKKAPPKIQLSDDDNDTEEENDETSDDDQEDDEEIEKLLSKRSTKGSKAKAPPASKGKAVAAPKITRAKAKEAPVKTPTSKTKAPASKTKAPTKAAAASQGPKKPSPVTKKTSPPSKAVASKKSSASSSSSTKGSSDSQPRRSTRSRK